MACSGTFRLLICLNFSAVEILLMDTSTMVLKQQCTQGVRALAKDVNFDKIARRTRGFTGAYLQNLMNKAAILGAKRELKKISKDEIADDLVKIIAAQRRKTSLSQKRRK